ncbi:MAG: DUF4349 domain-containing protein [Pyrinomonadaceae bacterium]
MRLFKIFIFTFALIFCAGCGAGRSPERSGGSVANSSTSVPASQGGAANAPAGKTADGSATVQNVSLQQAATSQAAPAAVERKIIRNADLTVELDTPAEGQQRIASLAEAHGGFVVTSESRQRSASGGDRTADVITMEVRVPAAQFDAVIGEIRKLGSHVTDEKITGQDVTEEYIDLEARIRTQQALEAQFLVIMKGASEVSDALAVQRELANVRTEIERLEGRRRFLENQTSLSTIKVTLQPPTPLVSTTGFFHGIKSAFGDGIDAAATITLFLIRFVIVLIPIFVLLILPSVLIVRFIVRRFLTRRAPVIEKPHGLD